MVNSILAQARAAAAALMTATCHVYRKTGSRRDGVRVVAVWELVYAGRCKLQAHEGHERAVGGALEASSVEQRSSLHLPVGSLRTQPGDVAAITGSTDPLLVGRMWRIEQQFPVKEHATAYRVFVDELVGDHLAEFDDGEVAP